MMAEVARDVVLAKLKALGIDAVDRAVPVRRQRRATRHGSRRWAWDMKGGELWVESVLGKPDFVPFRLCRYADVPMCVSTYSKGGEWSGELIDVGAGIDGDGL